MIDAASDSLLLQNNVTKGSANSQTSLGKNDFLQLLVAQLKNQSPTQPMKDKEFISQMATFSSLEQMQNMNYAMQGLLKSHQDRLLMENAHLIGKQVSWQSEENEEQQINQGKIQEIVSKDGAIKFKIEDGSLIQQDQLVSIGISDKDNQV